MRLKFQKRSVGEWRPKESRKLLSLANECELHWSKIADYFPDRNPHQIRSKFCCLQKRKDRPFEISGQTRVRKRIIYKNAKGFIMSCTRSRQRPKTEIEVDEKLNEIFNTYSSAKSNAKSLVCRSAQDEAIYQHLLHTIQSHIFFPNSTLRQDSTLIGRVLLDAFNERITYATYVSNSSESNSQPPIAPPTIATIRGYKCWSLLQDYLKEVVCNKFTEDELNSIDINDLTSTEEYNVSMKQVTSLFLWPAVLNRIDPPNIDTKQFSNIFENSIVNKGTLYIVRELQKQMTTFNR